MIWELVYDIATWTTWNPLYVEASGVIRIGEILDLTVALAQWGFREDELRKLLGLNFLRVYRDIAG